MLDERILTLYPAAMFVPEGRNTGQREKAVGLWLKGLSYAEIGRALGLSRQRAYQLIQPPPQIRALVYGRYNGKCADCSTPVKSGHIHHDHAKAGDVDTFNDLEMLVYLCPACHFNRHREMPLDQAPQNYTCKRCNQNWRGIAPVRCPNPKCRSAYWDRERRIPASAVRKDEKL